MSLSRPFQPFRPVPGQYRRDFHHLYLDIAWFGVLSGSAIAFSSVFATRQGASALQIGLLNASPAITNLLFTLPSGRWLQQRRIGPAVFWTSVAHRLFYLSWVFLPLFLPAQGQIWGLILLTLLMSVPGTALAVGFNTLFAATVPPEWRSQVVGMRNALLAITYTATTLLCGWLLEQLPFVTGYQLVFGIGFFGAVMSSYHLRFLRAAGQAGATTGLRRPLRDWARPGSFSSWLAPQAQVGLRSATRLTRSPRRLWPAMLRGRFGLILLLLFLYHSFQYLSVPLLPLYWVNALALSDQQISFGNGLFYATVLLGSLYLTRLSGRWDNRRMVALGAVGLGLYTSLIGLSRDLTLYIIASAEGGLAWALFGGALANRLLEVIPEEERPAHLAWYNLALHAGILAGALTAPLLAGWLGLSLALGLVGLARIALGGALWRWG